MTDEKRAMRMAVEFGTRTKEDADTRREQFLEALRRTGNVTRSANIAGVSRWNAYLWKKRHADFARDWDDIMQGFIDAVEGRGIELALSGDTSLIRFFLQSWKRDVYAPEVNLRLEPDEGPVHRFIDFTGQDLISGEVVDEASEQEPESR